MKGWPDYTRVTGLVDNYDEYTQNYPVGIGDGAARLGSIKTHDMRGRVWWMDDFEAATLHWDNVSFGAGGAQGLITDHVRNGQQALGLTANTGFGRLSRARRVFSLPRSIPIGLEFHFAQEANFGIFETLVGIDDGAQITLATIRIDEAANQLQYINAAGGWSDSGINIGLSTNLTHFHAIKIVFDYNTDEWLRIIYDNQEVNLDREAMRTTPTAGGRYLLTQFDNVGDNVANARVIIDDNIITVMEPE